MRERAPGFYWVEWDGHEQDIARWTGSDWRSIDMHDHWPRILDGPLVPPKENGIG